MDSSIAVGVIQAVVAPLPRPQSVTVSVLSTSRIDLTWSAVERAGRYIIERRVKGETGWTLVGVTINSIWHDTGLAAATRYEYRILVTGCGVASESAVVMAATHSFPFSSSPTIS
jgi:hypothetical protein